METEFKITKRFMIRIYFDYGISVGIHPRFTSYEYCFAILIPFISLDFIIKRKYYK